MYKFLQRNKKKLLAVFGVGLMIVFILPSTPMGQQPDPVVGTVGGGDELRLSSFNRAQAEWEMLSRIPLTIGDGRNPVTMLLGPFAVNQINQNPEVFPLLLEEARRMGVQVNRDRVQEILRNYVRLPENADPQMGTRLEQGLQDLMLVQAAYDRAASTIKISQPVREHKIAQLGQTISVNVVEFAASEFADDVPAPTTQQVQEQFEKFADALPESTPAGTFGFGYKIPDRVKLQYISVAPEDVRAVIEKKRSPYEWEVQAYKYYDKNQSLFPTTQQSETDGMTLGSTQPTASTGPTTKPFEEVKENIRTRLIGQEAEKLLATIQNELAATLGADWTAYQKASGAATGPTTAPAAQSSVGSAYNGFDYLHQLAAKIQLRFGVLPGVASLGNEYLSMDALDRLPGIGSARIDNVSVGQYIQSHAELLVAEDQKNDPKLLSLLEPSPPARDTYEGVYFFRITDLQPAHKPASIDEVADKVRQDVRAQEALARARAAAEKFLETAKQQGLQSAANQLNRRMVSTGDIRNSPSAEIPNYSLETAARAEFIEGAFSLLTEAAKTDAKHPIKPIELPRAGRVVVTELNEVKAPWDEETFVFTNTRLAQQMMSELEQVLQMGWFNLDSLTQRLDYQPTEARAQAPSAPAGPVQPRTPF